MISNVWYMIYDIMYAYDVMLTFHTKYNLKSYMMAYVNDASVIYDVMCIIYHVFCVWYSIWYLQWFFSGQFQPCSNAAPGQLKCNRIWIKCRPPCSSPTSVCLSWHQNRVAVNAVVYYSISGISQNALASLPSSLTSLPRPSWLGSCLSDFGASLYYPTSLRLMYPEYSASSTSRPRQWPWLAACASARPAIC